MFSVQELQLIAGACFTEMEMMRSLEVRGIPTQELQATISGLRVKVLRAMQVAQRDEAAQAAEKKAD